jgi:CheY-like chemotaxis protein
VGKLPRRFETVPLAQVPAAAVEVIGDGQIKNKKDKVDGSLAIAGTETLREQPMTPDLPTPQLQSGHTALSRQSGGAMEAKPPPKRVLVVDDEDHVANTLVAILRERGYEAAASHDAIKALAHCEAWRPDLVADVVMPGMNRIELAMVVKQLFPSCHILLVSDLATSEDFIQDAQRDGYDFELLTKPVRLAELLARIDALT